MSETSPNLGDLLQEALGHGRQYEPGEDRGAVMFDTATVLTALLTSGQDHADRGCVTDLNRLAQVVRVGLDIFAKDLPRPWLVLPGSRPVAGCERPMTLGQVLTLLLTLLPDSTPSPDVYKEVQQDLSGFGLYLKGWYYQLPATSTR